MCGVVRGAPWCCVMIHRVIITSPVNYVLVIVVINIIYFMFSDNNIFNVTATSIVLALKFISMRVDWKVTN